MIWLKGRYREVRTDSTEKKRVFVFSIAEIESWKAKFESEFGQLCTCV